MTVPVPRGACPSLAKPMETGDGLISRLPGADLPWRLPVIRGIAEAAERFGNGMIEVSARGSVQVRGLTPATAGPFARAMTDLGLAEPPGPPVLTEPLAGAASGLADAREVASALRIAFRASPVVAGLAPKVSVVVDGGSAPGLDEVPADIHLAGAVARDRTIWHVAAGGDARTAMPVGAVAADDAVPAVLALLALIAAEGPRGRARDVLRAGGAGPFRAALAPWMIETGTLPSRPVRGAAIGVHRVKDGGVAVGLGFPFGQCEAAALRRLADIAEEGGATAVAPAPGRTLLVLGLAADRAPAFTDRAAGLGFVVDPGDPRRSVFACAGRPACSAALMPARAIAGDIARAAAPMLDGSLTLHLSGCAKGCARQGATSLTLVGTESGWGIITDGDTRAAPHATVPGTDLVRWVAGVARDVADGRRASESAAETFGRLARRPARVLEDAPT